MNVAKILCESVHQTKYDNFSSEEIKRAKYRLIDAFGVIACGMKGSGNDMAMNILRQWSGRAEATVFNYGDRLPAHHAAMMNSMMMRSQDYEAVQAQGIDSFSAPAHVSGSTIPVALSVAEWKRRSGKEMLTALLLGDDLACRLATAGDSSPFNNPWDNTGTVNGLGAVVTAGCLLGLTSEQMQSALGIAVNQLSGSIGSLYNSAMAFKLPMALAAKNAIFSAELAEQGFTAMEDAICGKGGYFELFCDSYSIMDLMHEFGKTHYADIVIKPHAACRATHPSIDAAIKIKEKYNLNPDEIDLIVVHERESIVKSFVGGEFYIGKAPEINGKFNLHFTVATGLIYGSVRPEHFTAEMMNRPILHALISKTQLVGDRNPKAGEPSATIEVFMKNGDRYEASMRNAARGEIFSNPLTETEIIEKYYHNISFGSKAFRENAEKGLDFIMEIEKKQDILPLITLFS